MTYIKDLILTNYRVYKNKKFSFEPNINIIYGKNGIGKTNILESLSFLTAGKGMLGANIGDVLRITEQPVINYNWTIFANIEDNNIADTIAIYSENDNNILKKKIKINGNIVRSQEELNKILNVLWLTPDMQTLFIDEKANRRKFLDRIVYIVDNNHSSRINKYEFLVKERMKVLQDSKKFDEHWLTVLEEKIAETGISIAVARNQVIRHLNRILVNYDFDFPKFIITIDGRFENLLLDNITAMQAEEEFRKILKDNRQQDNETKRTAEGVHKSDLRLFYQTKNMDAQFCSTGEQKLFLISFTILKALLCKELNKPQPIILLDEVFSYLDKNKKLELFNELLKLNVQSFITGTDITIFSDILPNDNVNTLNLEELLNK